MSQRVKIIVEGVADKTFLIQYVSSTFDIQLSCDDVITTGGWNEIKSNTFVNQLKKNTDDGGVNLVIFDADADIDARRAELEQIKQEQQNDDCEDDDIYDNRKSHLPGFLAVWPAYLAKFADGATEITDFLVFFLGRFLSFFLSFDLGFCFGFGFLALAIFSLDANLASNLLRLV